MKLVNHELNKVAEKIFPVFPCLDNLIHLFKSCLMSPDPKLLIIQTEGFGKMKVWQNVGLAK